MYGGQHTDGTPYSEEGQMKGLSAGRHYQWWNLWRSYAHFRRIPPPLCSESSESRGVVGNGGRTDLDGVVEMRPLAVCDPTTVSQEDIVAFEGMSQVCTRKACF